MGFSEFEEREIRFFSIEASGPTSGGGNHWFFEDSARPVRVDSVMARNPDSIDHTIRAWFGTDLGLFVLGEVVVPAGAGVGAVAPFDCLTPITMTGRPFLLGPVHTKFGFEVLVDILDSKDFDVVATVGEF